MPPAEPTTSTLDPHGRMAARRESTQRFLVRPALGLLAGAALALFLVQQGAAGAIGAPLLAGFTLCFAIPIWAVLESLARRRSRPRPLRVR